MIVMHEGYDEMPSELRVEVEHLSLLKTSYEDTPLTHLTLFGTKKAYEDVPEGAVITVIMEDNSVWMSGAMLLAIKHGGGDAAVFISDAYVRNYFDDPENLPKEPLVPGCLERSFKDGDMRVQEAMVLTRRTDDGLEYHVESCYHLGDDGQLEWDEPRWFVTEKKLATNSEHGVVSHILQVLLGHSPPSLLEIAAFLYSNADMEAL